MKKIQYILLTLVVCLITSCNKSDAVLMATAKQTNATCPIVVDEITTLEKVEYLISGYKRYTHSYIINEERITVDELKLNAEKMANNIKAQLESSSAPDVKELLKNLIEADAVIEYKYVGNQTGGKFTIQYFPRDKNTYIK